MSKKINPNRIPCTMADIKRAKDEAQDIATQATATIFLSVLCDKEGADKEIIQRVWKEINYLSESVANGEVDLWDLKKALEEESGILIGA